MAHLPCETFFVENDDTVCTTRTHARDLVKLYARRQQELMATELSRQAAEDYLEDIVNHMKRMEVETLADVASIDTQEEIHWFMRPYLLDFLIEAHGVFQLLPETLFLAINLLDRYCSKRVVYKRHYQLVGCTALLIAAKYGDRKERVPTVRELKSMCCGLYDEDMFLQMEWHVLNTLDWIIGHPTVDCWLQITFAEEHEDVEVEHMALYICEIALYHKEFVSVRPSVMARAALALARGILGRSDGADGIWNYPDNLTLVTLSQQLYRPSPAVVRKYSSPHLSRVATTLEHFLTQQSSISRCSPPSPPEAVAVQQKPMADNSYIYNTPQKGQNLNINGYLTPPITPEGDQFLGANAKGYYANHARRPITPTPAGNAEYGSQQQYVEYHDSIMY